MVQIAGSLTGEIKEIESFFLLLADYTKNIIFGDDVFNEVSCIQYGILSFLSSNDRVTVNDIVKSQNINYPSSSQLLDELSKLGLVVRKRSDEDRRLVFITITDKGREMIAAIHQRRHVALKQIFEGFEPDAMKLIMNSFSLLKNKLITLKDKDKN
jgi:DNA-binding MarR family transcriptional regulator